MVPKMAGTMYVHIDRPFSPIHSLCSHSVNFVYQSSSTPQPKQVFQLFTPANLGTHGAIAKDGEEISFTVSPRT